MASDETQPMGQSQQQLIKVLHNNTSQQLNRHVKTNGTIQTDVSDFILKKGDYANTYIAIDTSGLPDGVTLVLCDENSNSLYSPVDTNHNWQTTLCSITVGETDIIPLPAQFNNQLSAHTPFPVGTYNWKLKFNENDYYYEEEIPLTVEIRDFKVWEIQTPQIYPGEDIKVKIKTYADTYYPTVPINITTENSTYDPSTGIITYTNIDTKTLGKNTKIINQTYNSFVDFEVKNPASLTFSKNPPTLKYKDNMIISGQIASQTTTKYGTFTCVFFINENNKGSGYISGSGRYIEIADHDARNILIPGSYQVYCTWTNDQDSTQQYTSETQIITITVTNCSLSLQYDEEQLVSSYQYNNEPIPNAQIGLIDVNNNALIETAISDAQGQCIWATTEPGIYKSVAYDMRTNEVILESNIIAPLVYNVDIDNNGDLITNKYDNISNSSISVIDSIIDDEGDLLISTTQYNSINDVEDAIYDIDIDENGDIYYNAIGD